ncbi:MAG TPA: signal peptidase I, partial [Chloroflexota bacterium]|nr:signal peptidase I [Chloroflexota bacterium]
AIRDVLETLILTVLIFFVVQSIVKNFRVEGTSMEPTLQNNEFLLVDRAVYWSLPASLVNRVIPSAAASNNSNSDGRVFLFHGPERGDIIVFQYPRDPTRQFIKRVIGVPGDVVQIQDSRVYVDNVPLNEPYIMAPPHYTMAAEKVPPGEYFVLGDNRNDSSDSHVWGMVPWYYITGQTWISYWPLSDWRFFPAGTVAAR